jgi:hypothetical protein
LRPCVGAAATSAAPSLDPKEWAKRTVARRTVEAVWIPLAAVLTPANAADNEVAPL